MAVETLPVPSPEQIATRTAYPPSMEVSKPTSTPSPTPVGTTVPDSILENGQTWYANGWSLTVTNFTYETYYTLHFTLRNLNDRAVIFPVIEYDKTNIHFDNDDYGVPCEKDGFDQQKIRNYGKVEGDWGGGGGTRYGYLRTYSPDSHTITLVVENIGDIIVNARWQTEIPRPN